MAVLVVHCGAHSSDAVLDAATLALDEGLGVLRAGGDAMEAVLRAVVVLENDERTNAGTGSRLNLAGGIEMDASVMDSRGQAGAVGAITGVQNPILVAREVLDSPHLILVGNGATRFAREAGFPEYDAITAGAQQALNRVKAAMARSATRSREREAHAGDTVGAVARDDEGYMAAANSTGGIAVQLPGRLGDTPVIGAGIYAGSAGAVTATGIGEAIIRAVLAKDVYDRIAAGTAPQAACDEGVRRFDADAPVGLIAVDGTEAGAASNTHMAWRSGEV
ncbi:MAG: isoaspartyl peptidase/L-asparaginase family protein [Thermoplasmata archaeon]